MCPSIRQGQATDEGAFAARSIRRGRKTYAVRFTGLRETNDPPASTGGSSSLERKGYFLFALRRLTSTLRAASKRCDTSFQFHTFQIASKNSVFRFSYWR